MTNHNVRFTVTSAMLVALVASAACGSRAHAQTAVKVAPASSPARSAPVRPVRYSSLDFADDVSAVFPEATIQDVIGMRVHHITIDYVLDVKELFPKASLQDVIGMRAQRMPIDYAREVLVRYPSATLSDVVGLWIKR